jgi:hypothetical protein
VRSADELDRDSVCYADRPFMRIAHGTGQPEGMPGDSGRLDGQMRALLGNHPPEPHRRSSADAGTPSLHVHAVLHDVWDVDDVALPTGIRGLW